MTEVDTGPVRVGSHSVTAGIDGRSAQNSAVSWAAILAGAAGAAALSLILLILGTGLGFSALSPWTTEGISAATFGFVTIAWLMFTQVAASGMGGYLAGRLRTRWTAVPVDEVYFRDTAHGFLSWAVATLLTAAVLTSVVGSIVGGGVRAGAAVAGGAADSAATLATDMTSPDDVSDTIDYFVDSLFRGDRTTGGGPEIPAGEVTQIFAQALRTGTLSQEDRRYVGRLIAQRTDLNQQQAEQRVAEGFERVQTTLVETETAARELADEAREAAARGALWMFVALLSGAFVASLMAVFGGRQRDLF